MRVDDRIFREFSLPSVLERTSTEEKCRQWLTQLRWPNGVVCSRCGGTANHLHSRPENFECRECHSQFSIRSNTPLHDSHLPLNVWLVAVYLIATSSKGLSARQLGRWFDIPYKTAWHLNHRIRSIMLFIASSTERQLLTAGTTVSWRSTTAISEVSIWLTRR